MKGESLGLVDRTPPLAELVRAEDLERCLVPFIVEAIDGVMVFAADGLVHAGGASESSPMKRWEQLPPEAVVASRSGGCFGFDDHVFDVRPVFASTDRVGVLIVSRQVRRSGPADERLADALSNIIGQILQSAYATWVTSQLHLAASESSWRVLTQRNDELERALAHLRDVDELKSNFLATISHELRTPLTSIIGFSEMLLEGVAGELVPDQATYIRTIMERGEELLALISEMLEISQLEMGAVRLELQATWLPDVVTRAIETLKPAASRAGIEVIDALDASSPSAPLWVLVDAEKLRRILLNLVGNAIKFSPSGARVTVCARVAPIRRPFDGEALFGEESDDALRITVRDTGSGIPEDQLERIFEAFYQGDASSTRRHGGAGLGLSIVRNLVAAHGGEVWAESRVGVGTAFHFTLPRASEAAVGGAAD